MPPTFTGGGYVGPGFYVKQKDVSTPNVPQSSRVPAIIGQGAKTLNREDILTRGSDPYGQEGPLAHNTVVQLLSVIDANNVVYTQGVDYFLNRAGADVYVSWNKSVSLVGTVDLTTLTYAPGGVLNGFNMALIVDGVALPGAPPSPINFTDPVDENDVVNQINAWTGIPGLASLNGSNQLVLTAKSLEADYGTALNLLGFTTGQIPTPNSAARFPAAGLQYQVIYSSDKLAVEYKPVLLSNMNDVISLYGPKTSPVTIATGAPSSIGAATLTDGTKTWAVDELVGNYVKITDGPGTGQVRVIISNTSNTITLSQGWTVNVEPTVASTYLITDVNYNSITLGSQISFDTGGTFVIASQYADDLFNDRNIKAAINNLKDSIQGSDPDCLVLMRGLGATEYSPISFLKSHCEEMSNVLNNKFRVAFIGLAQGNTLFTDFANIANGTKSRRVTLMNISEVKRDFGDGRLISLDGSYVAAAFAGVYCAAVDAGEPITRKSVGVAFDVAAFVDPFLVTEKNFMAGAGVTIIERQGTDLRIRHALTTDNTSIFTQEVKLTRSADFISKYLRSNLENLLTGQRFVVSAMDAQADVVGTARANFVFLLEALKNPQQQIITSYSDLAVAQNQTEKRQLDFRANIYLTTDVLWEYALLGFTV